MFDESKSAQMLASREVWKLKRIKISPSYCCFITINHKMELNSYETLKWNLIVMKQQ